MIAEHCRLVVESSVEDLERLATKFETLGTLGWEERPARDPACRSLIAYFEEAAFAEVAAVDWAVYGGRRAEVDRPSSEDWMARYRELAAPRPLGGGFFVDAREPDATPAAEPGERRLLRIPAREAFGTGSHESTQIAVELLEGLELGGARLLDVGIGTGVLSFVAASLGARALGFDIDPASAFAVRENSSLNRIGVPAWCGTMEALGVEAVFDVVVANVRPERLEGQYPRIVRAVAPGGALLLSGFLGVEEGVVAQIARPERLNVAARGDRGEWAGWVLRRPS